MTDEQRDAMQWLEDQRPSHFDDPTIGTSDGEPDPGSCAPIFAGVVAFWVVVMVILVNIRPITNWIASLW